MPENAVQPADEFLLSLVPKVLKGFVLPQGPFDANGAWKHEYRSYGMASQFYPDYDAKVGMLPLAGLRIERTPHAGGGCTLAVEVTKETAGKLLQRIAGKLVCAGDPLSTPVAWDLTETLCTPFGALEYRPTMRKAGKRTGRTVEITMDGVTARPEPGAYSSNWSLFDAVQRLPRQAGNPLRFTFLDGCELPKRGHTLAFRKTVNVELPVPEGEKTLVTLHRFEQIGAGFSPATYWTDEQGRLLFFISGIDVLVMAPVTFQRKESA